MNEDQRAVVEQYFSAMRRKAGGIEDLIALFDDNAVYVEPFSAMGQPTTRSGKSDIGAFLRATPENTPPDMEVSVDRIDLEGRHVRADWTCTSAAFARPMRGYDLFEIEKDKIIRLETTLTEAPDAQ